MSPRRRVPGPRKARPKLERPYSFAELDPLIAARLEPISTTSHSRLGLPGEVVHVTAERTAELFGVATVRLRRWRKVGLTVWDADLCAIRLGYMPWQVWPEWLPDVIEPDAGEGAVLELATGAASAA